MKKIPLTRGMVALVDDEDYEELMQWEWRCASAKCLHYAVRGKRIKGKYVQIQMHQVILNTPYGYDTDHINGNGLDNRKGNLRVATHLQNCHNTRIHSDNTSGYKGVTWDKSVKKWKAQIGVNNKNRYLGIFNDRLEAAKAYNEAAKKYYGKFAHLNQTDG